MNKVLVIGSSTKCKGGIATVIKNFLSYNDWRDYKLKHIVSHVDGNKISKLFVFVIAYFKLLLNLIFTDVRLIHIHMSMNASFYRKASFIKMIKKFNKPIIIHHHGSQIFNFYKSLDDEKKKYFVDILSMVDINIVLSNQIKNDFYNISELIKTKVVYNAVTTYEQNNYNINGNYILFLGRMGERKGTYDLLKVIANINNNIDSKYKFVFCGDGEINNVRNIINDYNINNRCIVYGWINDNNKKMNIFSNTILNLLPSYNEGLPMTILETMSYGIPNISTNIASIPEVINETNGYLLTPGDLSQLEKQIVSFLNLSDIEKLMISKNAYNTILDNFKISASINKIINIYDELLK